MEEKTMFDLLMSGAAAPMPRYAGPERRGADSALWRWMAAMLDEIDYGMLLVVDEMRVIHANHVARAELDNDHPLQMLGQQLRVRRSQDVAPLRDAVAAAATRGLRRLLTLGDDAHRVSVAVVPLSMPSLDSRPATLLVFGKRRMCEELSVHWFARSHKLTQAEAQVLKALCTGVPPSEIAQRQGVAISTVRTQISSIRAKTGAESIRNLVHQVAVLPPLVGVLRDASSRALSNMRSLPSRSPWQGPQTSSAAHC
jgi:DNA-binding CsgD family transcriptional regulator